MAEPDEPGGAAAGALDHVEVWIFDLDNTLYPARCNLFDQIDRRMGAFIAALLEVDPVEARAVQKQYFHEHGSTLRGLMLEHGMEPRAFLDYVHDIDLTPVPPSPALDRALGRLKGRKLVFTNGSTRHAERVMGRLGITDHFEAVFDIAAADFLPKPDPIAYAKLVARFDIDPGVAAMVEDIPRNLKPAAALGMTTVWVPGTSPWSQAGPDDDHIDHVVPDLADWLTALVDGPGQPTASG